MRKADELDKKAFHILDKICALEEIKRQAMTLKNDYMIERSTEDIFKRKAKLAKLKQDPLYSHY